MAVLATGTVTIHHEAKTKPPAGSRKSVCSEYLCLCRPDANLEHGFVPSTTICVLILVAHHRIFGCPLPTRTKRASRFVPVHQVDADGAQWSAMERNGAQLIALHSGMGGSPPGGCDRGERPFWLRGEVRRRRGYRMGELRNGGLEALRDRNPVDFLHRRANARLGARQICRSSPMRVAAALSDAHARSEAARGFSRSSYFVGWEMPWNALRSRKRPGTPDRT